MWRCNEEIWQRVAQLERTSQKEAKHYIGIVFLSMCTYLMVCGPYVINLLFGELMFQL